MQEQGIEFGPGPGTGGGQGPLAGLSEEERAAMRATRQAGGQGRFADMSEEERANMRASAEASGVTFGGGRGPGRGLLNVLAEPLVELLADLAGS